MTETGLFAVVLGMGAITYGLRVGSLLLAKRLPRSAWLASFLRFVPVAVLSAIVALEVFASGGQLDLSLLENHRLQASVLAILVAWRSRSMLLTIAVGLLNSRDVLRRPPLAVLREGLRREPRVTAALEEATRRAGVEPRWVPIRGGTDGSRLTAMGLPTPNIFAGGQNFHGKTEWLSVEGMERSLETVTHLLGVWVEMSATKGPRPRP